MSDGSVKEAGLRGQPAPVAGPSPPSIMEYLRFEYRRAQRYWYPIHEAELEERSFYDGQHYHEDIPRNQANADNLYVVGQETFNVVRHKLGQLTDTPHQLEARPADRGSGDDDTNANDAEVATAILQSETEHPQKDFDDCSEMMALSALASRIGIIAIDWDPDMGPFGEVMFRPVDATRCMWEPGYHDPHHLSCRWFSEDVPMLLDELRSMPGIDKELAQRLHPEIGRAVNRTASSNISPRHANYERGDDLPQDMVLVRRWWFKHDPTTKRKTRPSVTLKPRERYMTCGAPGAPGCGWRSEVQGAGKPFPEDEPNGCPDCGGPTMRVDERVPEDEVLVYPKGKRLIIETPNQPAEKPLYDGAWPTVRYNPRRNIRSFPFYVFTAYLPSDPTSPTGPSDTRLNWTAQAASDYLMTKAFRSAKDFQRYYLMPETGINDHRGLRFEFKDDQLNLMFFDPEQVARMGPDGMAVRAIDGSQFDPSLPAFWGMMQQVLNGKQGIADFSMTPQNSRNIPATTVAQMTQLAEIPIAHLRRRYRRALAKGHGVLWDYLCATYTPGRLRRMHIGSGVDQMLEVHGDELPNFDFIISDVPEFDGLEKSKSEALDRLIQVPAEWQEVYAQVNNLSRGILRKVQKVQKQQAQSTGMTDMGGGGAGPVPPTAGATAPMNGAMPGMVPGGATNRVAGMMSSRA